MAKIGMSTGVSAASTDLGLGGALADQVKDETDEERKKRRIGLSVMQSPAASMMLGLGGARGG